MLEELLKEINELKQYKKLYEYAVKDKEQMSKLLYEYMVKEYNTMTDEERVAKHREAFCCYCRYDDCKCNFQKDLWLPIPSEKAYIPGRMLCDNFEWS